MVSFAVHLTEQIVDLSTTINGNLQIPLAIPFLLTLKTCEGLLQPWYECECTVLLNTTKKYFSKWVPFISHQFLMQNWFLVFLKSFIFLRSYAPMSSICTHMNNPESTQLSRGKVWSLSRRRQYVFPWSFCANILIVIQIPAMLCF